MNLQFLFYNFQNPLTSLGAGKNKKQSDKKTFRTAFIIVLFFILSVFITPLGNVKTAKADEFDQKLNDLNSQINDLNNQIDVKKGEKRTVKNQIAIFDNQIYQIQLKIDKTNIELSKLQGDIESTTVKIKEAEDNLLKQKEILNENLRILYEEGQTSSVEVVAGSDNFSEFMNKTEYLKSIQDKVSESIDKIKQLKIELDAKKKELETKKTEQLTLKNQQVSQQKDLSSQRATKNTLLAQVVNQESELKTILEVAHKEKEGIYAERLRRMQQDNVTYGGGSSSYPYSEIDVPDPWLFYTRECTSYVAWKWNAVYGKPFYNTRPGEGDAKNWATLAADQGYSVSSTPRVGSIMVSREGTWGHVAIVERVYPNGTFGVSEYNYLYRYNYDTRGLGANDTSGLYPAGYQFIY